MQLESLIELADESLRERTRILKAAGGEIRGELVLYWMHASIRGSENQTLSMAIFLANRLRLPLLVYQGLSERYPYASDRHHWFILQGAKDVQQQFTERGIPYALYVERPGHREPFLRRLAERAAIVVTEDMPVEPLRSWRRKLCQSARGPVLAVDSACVVPSQLIGRAHDRASAFRAATKSLYATRMTQQPLELSLDHSRSITEIERPFQPVDLQVTEIADLVAECQIDHSIGPVTHTVGGSTAGYHRWNLFQQHSISRYHRLRNDPLEGGVSRLSPYLHFGMVAATRIAREASANGSKGAQKFLDELLIWRELAYAFCHYRTDHRRLSAIPEWARQTLADHAGDRDALLPWEQLARGRTGDSLWDSAQRSLLIQGELHGNMRMTWGKALLNWTPDAKQALAMMIDLNHRYALDGRDPASYGGILWCLGQFDRPFSPAQPVFGVVRERSTKQHATRLDPVRYRQRVTRSLWESIPSIGVVGAGVSGLMCARTLMDHGCQVQVFEKSRGYGGRMATRRSGESLQFDNGAQYFTARDKRFVRYVKSWEQSAVVQSWDGTIVTLNQGTATPKASDPRRYVATPKMNALGKHLAEDLSVHLNTRVQAAKRSGDQWQFQSATGENLGTFDQLVVAVPAPQACELLRGSPLLAKQAASVSMTGCWAMMVAFQRPLEVAFDGAFVQDSILSWIAKDSSKPQRGKRLETWVLHGSTDWTEQHLNDSPASIGLQLREAFWKALGIASIDPVTEDLKLWRFAIPTNPVGETSLYDPDAGVGACGDWCGGPRVEGAFLSGVSLAGQVLRQLAIERGVTPDFPVQPSFF